MRVFSFAHHSGDDRLSIEAVCWESGEEISSFSIEVHWPNNNLGLTSTSSNSVEEDFWNYWENCNRSAEEIVPVAYVLSDETFQIFKTAVHEDCSRVLLEPTIIFDFQEIMQQLEIQPTDFLHYLHQNNVPFPYTISSPLWKIRVAAAIWGEIFHRATIE